MPEKLLIRILNFMCGIAGIVELDEHHLETLKKVKFLVEQLRRRGPDSNGVISYQEDSLVLGHTRLAIQDLSKEGHQPMKSSSGRYSISFNGEIYNHLKLRRKYLNKITFRGSSDTETVLALIEEMGFIQTIALLEGMFALFVFDHNEKKFFLTRDRMGEKPIAFFKNRKKFMFCSQVNSLHSVIPQINKEINLSSVQLFLNFGFIPSPLSIYGSIQKLQPGEVLVGSLKENCVETKISTYWSLEKDYLGKQRNNNCKKADLENILLEVISDELVSDRKIGAFLSGGVDSSLICLLAKEIDNNLNTFSIGFENESYSELKESRFISEILKTDHTEILCTEKDILNIVPDLKEVYDEPFADQSQIPTLLLCKLAREAGNIVCLTGDGGDELFGGYNRHKNINRFISLQKLFSFLGKSRISELNLSSSNRFLNDYLRWFSLAINSSEKSNLSDIYMSFLNKTSNKNIEYKYNPNNFLKGLDVKDSYSQSFMNFDMRFYIGNDILVKTDRASMYNGLELRSPFLHPRVIDYSAGLPISEKIYEGKTKKILKEILYKHLPSSFVNQKKKGFDVPLSSWIRNDLREWVADISNSEGPSELKDIDAMYKNYIELHMDKNYDYTNHIWPYLMLKDWFLCQR